MTYGSFLNSPTRIAIADFLNFEFINKGIWFFNVWSIVHFLVGAGLIAILLLAKVKPSTRYIIFFGLIFGYEVFELIMSSTTRLFEFESVKDIFWDIILASAGAGVIELIFWINNI